MKKFIVILLLLIVTIFYSFSCEEKTDGYSQPWDEWIQLLDYTTSNQISYFKVKRKKNYDPYFVSLFRGKNKNNTTTDYIPISYSLNVVEANTNNLDFYEYIGLYDTNTNFIFKITNKVWKLSDPKYSTSYLYISNDTLTNAYWGTTNE